jgi:hypothetical protein
MRSLMRILLPLCVAGAGCTTATGGAVELSWKLRPVSGATTDPDIPSFLDCGLFGTDGLPLIGRCSTTGSACRIDSQCGAGETCLAREVSQIELDWDVGSTHGSTAFPCNDGNGRTAFVLATGTATIMVAPRCQDGLPADPRTYVAPAPVQYTVELGQTISVGAIELILDVSSCSQQRCVCD